MLSMLAFPIADPQAATLIRRGPRVNRTVCSRRWCHQKGVQIEVAPEKYQEHQAVGIIRKNNLRAILKGRHRKGDGVYD